MANQRNDDEDDDWKVTYIAVRNLWSVWLNNDNDYQ